MNQIFDTAKMFTAFQVINTQIARVFFYGCGSTKDQEVTESSDLQKKAACRI